MQSANRHSGSEEPQKYYPSELFGGQKQRLAIARTLTNYPDILISNEATIALDPQNSTQILLLIKPLNQKLGLIELLITYEMDEGSKIFRKVVVMENGQIIERNSTS